MGEGIHLCFRPAVREDLPELVDLLAQDPLGATRETPEDPLPAAYGDAFDAISEDPNHELMIAESDDAIVATFQLSFLPYLTYRGGWRALLEAVRVSPGARGRGVGTAVIEWVVDRARRRGCHLVQLTTDKSRPGAIRFYERAGFRPSHEGMKLDIVEEVEQVELAHPADRTDSDEGSS